MINWKNLVLRDATEMCLSVKHSGCEMAIVSVTLIFVTNSIFCRSGTGTFLSMGTLALRTTGRSESFLDAH